MGSVFTAWAVNTAPEPISVGDGGDDDDGACEYEHGRILLHCDDLGVAVLWRWQSLAIHDGMRASTFCFGPRPHVVGEGAEDA